MSIIQQIFSACSQIMRISIPILGYNVSLMQFIVYCFIALLLIKIVRSFY